MYVYCVYMSKMYIYVYVHVHICMLRLKSKIRQAKIALWLWDSGKHFPLAMWLDPLVSKEEFGSFSYS